MSPYDRGLHYGDGLFETIVCVKGRRDSLSLHMERLSLRLRALAHRARRRARRCARDCEPPLRRRRADQGRSSRGARPSRAAMVGRARRSLPDWCFAIRSRRRTCGQPVTASAPSWRASVWREPGARRDEAPQSARAGARARPRCRPRRRRNCWCSAAPQPGFGNDEQRVSRRGRVECSRQNWIVAVWPASCAG